MSFRATIEGAWTHHRLVSALVELTYVCNLNCSFCYNDLSLAGKNLSLSQYRALLDDLAEAQVLYLILTGGEPLSHPHFFEIGAHAKSLGFVTRIKTNGHAVGPKIARRIKDEVDPYRLEVSLHGATAEVHDRQTRVAGSFARLTSNCGAMRDAGLRVQVNIAMTRWNEHQIEEMFALVARAGFSIQVDDEVKPRDDGDETPRELQASAAALVHLQALQREHAAPPPSRSQTGAEALRTVSGTDKHCGAGASTLAVDPVGNVLPCVQWRMPVGNLHEQRLSEIWQGSPLEGVRDITRQVKKTLEPLGDAGVVRQEEGPAPRACSGD